MQKDTIKNLFIATEGDIEDAITEVLRLVKEGYTSGYSPTWNLTEEEAPLIK